MKESGSRSLLTQFKAGITKWRLAFLIFAIIYALLASIDFANTPIQWDEGVHLNNALFLLNGEYAKFNYFYPPLFDSVTMVFFKVFGVTVLSARLVSVTFSILSLWIVFEFAYSMYGAKTALTASILLGLCPAYFWLSRLALIETMLVFFFTASLFLFFKWVRSRQSKMLILSGLLLGLGFLTKYQALIAAAIMGASILLLTKDHIRLFFSKFTILIMTAVTVAVPWIIISYETYVSRMLGEWVYALQVGNPEKSLYSARYPLPIFYLIEMVWPFSEVHPISLFLYSVSLLGLGLLAWRRKKEDVLLIIWFIVVFVFFTLIPNKHWRYVLPLFPVLAFSAASFIFFFYEKTESTWRGHINISINKKRVAKIAAGLFTIFLAVGVVFTVKDAYDWSVKYQIQIDIEGATNYASNSLNQNEAIMILCPFNFFDKDMVSFYLWADGIKKNHVYQYPESAVDTYTPDFNITEFVSLCKQGNVKYVFTYEYGGVVPYFNTTLNLQKIYMMLYDSGNFSHISDDATFGLNPRRIFVLTFLG